MKDFGRTVRWVATGLICCAIGLLAGRWSAIRLADLLPLAGTLIGAGTGVLGAFGASRYAANRERREAIAAIRAVAVDLIEAMDFLLRFPREELVIGGPERAAAIDRLDRIFLSLSNARWILTNSAILTATRSPSSMSAALRLSRRIEMLEPHFDVSSLNRRESRIDAADHQVPPAAIAGVRAAGVNALAEMK